MFFHPLKIYNENNVLTGVSKEEVYFSSADGVGLHGMIPRPTGQGKGTILYLHGNTGNLSTHANAVHWLVKNGYTVFTFDYRGYGKSHGTPDIRGVNQDGIAAIDQVFHIGGASSSQVVVFGQSLGGAVAVYAVANSPHKGEVKALIIDSSFYGYRRIVRDKVASLVITWPLAYPASWTVDDHYSPEHWISSIAPIPVIVIHGTKDTIVPFSHGEMLFRDATNPKEFWAVEGTGHVAGLATPDVRRQFLKFLNSVLQEE